MSAPLAAAAEITGLAQQAVEKLHELRTYYLSSARALRHERELDDVRRALVEARNKMAALSLLLGKEGA